ncbi:MAG TPA: hypothetical protein VNO23_11935 [Candidatus Binatia bacterium]|nr:hypothetical protein [Candidatus Binatia bacterium]
MPFLHSFTSMLVAGADRDARVVVKRVAAMAADARRGAATAEAESSAA